MMIECKNLTRVYQIGSEQIHALGGISLKIGEGEFASIVGPSGCGKSTLLHILGCLDKPTSGEITIGGFNLSEVGRRELTKLRREKIGFVFQQFFLIPTLNVAENVCLPLLFSKKEADVESLLEIVNLGERMNHFPNQLSGGEMQRVAIARALVNRPEVLLADEPTGNLDSKNAAEIFNLFSKLNEDGLTLVVATHNLFLARNADRILHLKDGKVEKEEYV